MNFYQRIQLDLGLSVNIIKIEEPLEKFGGHEYFRPGLMIGGNLGIIEKRSYSLRLTTQANLMIGTVKVDSYEMTFLEDRDFIPERDFEEEKLWLPEIFLFISYMRKF